jgi:hypothetical protein
MTPLSLEAGSGTELNTNVLLQRHVNINTFYISGERIHKYAYPLSSYVYSKTHLSLREMLEI